MKAKAYIVALLAAVSWPALVQAQEADAAVSEVDEVVVTARRTAENLQDVPLAVSAFGAEALAQRGVDTLDQVAKYTPNIRFDGAAALSGGNYNATVFVRGVGQNDFAIFSDPGVGFYVDDVYYARSIGGVMDAVDIDNVQVLRGPQGTLFGKNTIGGAVLINTAAPILDEFSGKVQGVVGSFDRLDVKGAVNIPLADGLAAMRISAASLNRDGYVKRLFDGGTQGDRSAQMLRVKLRIEPNDALRIDLGADYTRARETSAPSDLLAVGNAPGVSGVPFLVNYNNFVAPTRGILAPDGRPTLNPSFITASPFQTWAGGPNVNDLDLWGVQGIITYELPVGATLKSITAYRDMEAYFTRDGDNTPFTFRQTTNRDDQWQFSHEMQLAGNLFAERLRYVVGGYYFREKASDIASADLAIGLWPPAVTTPPPSPAAFPNNYTNNKSWAVFGQLNLDLTDWLSITAGGRYSEDKKRFYLRHILQRNNVTYVDMTVSDKWSDFTPQFSVNLTPTEDILIYGSYAEGYKQGGFNGRPLVGPSEVTAYEPETIRTYELGVKAQWLDRALTTNLAVFHSKYKDIQLTVNQTPNNFVANAAAGEIDGAEFEVVARPSRWLSFNAAVGYLDAEYTSVGQGLGPTQVLPITTASRFVKAPKWSYMAGVEAAHEFEDGGRLAFRADLTSYSKIYHDVGNNPLAVDDGYTLANAKVTYTLAGDRVEVSAFVTNLTDELYLVSANVSGAFGLAEGSYGRPREGGISLTYRF